MANLKARDGAGALIELDAIGDGQPATPFVVTHRDLGVGLLTEPMGTSDIGAFSLIGLLKRVLSVKLPDVVAGRVPTIAPAIYGAPTIALTAALGTGASIDVSAYQRVRIQINNTGANSLSGFEISTKAHTTGDPQVHLNLPAHFTAPTAGSILRHCADLNGAAIDPTILAAGGRMVMAIDLRDFFASEIRIRATSAAGTNLQVYWGAA